MNAATLSQNVCYCTLRSDTATSPFPTQQPPTIAVRSGLRRFLQDRLGFEVVAFLQAGLLAFNPIGGFLNHGL